MDFSKRENHSSLSRCSLSLYLLSLEEAWATRGPIGIDLIHYNTRATCGHNDAGLIAATICVDHFGAARAATACSGHGGTGSSDTAKA